MDQAKMRPKASMPKPLTMFASSTSSAAKSGTIGEAGASTRVMMSEQRLAKKRSNMVEQAFNSRSREELNTIILRMLYTNGLSFSLIRTPYYSITFTYITNNPITNCKPL